MREKILKSRSLKQALCFTGTNGYIKGFFTGQIFTGATKKICVPGLNCYSCPGALFSCPIGALQQIMGDVKHRISFYAVGFIAAFGMLFGRLICGFLCPFGFLQDVVGKISQIKLSLPRWVKKTKYLILLAILVVPFLYQNVYGQSPPLFCTYICPSGTFFAGFPLLLQHKGLRGSIGSIFYIKISVFLLVLGGSIPIKRFFCKTLCPLGAFYALFNPISFYQMKVDKNLCINCGTCEIVCPMDVAIGKNGKDMECIRCGDCKRSCPTKAIATGFGLEKPKKLESL